MNSQFDIEEHVAFTILGGGVEAAVPARIVSISGKRVVVVSAATPALRTPVHMHWGHYLALAEVVGLEGDTGAIVLQISHFLDLQEVQFFRERWI
jgi:hypothetical protein